MTLNFVSEYFLHLRCISFNNQNSIKNWNSTLEIGLCEWIEINCEAEGKIDYLYQFYCGPLSHQKWLIWILLCFLLAVLFNLIRLNPKILFFHIKFNLINLVLLRNIIFVEH